MTQMSRQNEQVLLLPATPDRSLLLDFLELTKLRISLMVVVTAYVGFAVGLHYLMVAVDRGAAWCRSGLHGGGDAQPGLRSRK